MRALIATALALALTGPAAAFGEHHPRGYLSYDTALNAALGVGLGHVWEMSDNATIDVAIYRTGARRFVGHVTLVGGEGESEAVRFMVRKMRCANGWWIQTREGYSGSVTNRGV